MTGALARLVEYGQSPWYDNLTRAHARGGLRDLVAQGIRGVTSNPTIFEKAMGAGHDYDDHLRTLAGRSPVDAYWELVTDDIARAADVLAPVHESLGGADGFVSVEVDPDLAHDTAGTIAQAHDLAARLARPNVMIKIPATIEGLPAVTACIRDGINVNVTLIFSLERYAAVVDAYLAGLDARVAAGGDPGSVHSVASFFVSRVDTETDRRLPDGHPLRGRAAVANAKLAYRHFRARFAGPSWAALERAGARVQRPLWASTSTKNPAYSPTLYVDELVGADTVNTLAQASLDALRDHDGLAPATIERDVEGAARDLDGLAAAGVDFDDVTATLEHEGVAAFSASYHDALATLEKKARELGAAVR